MDSTATLLAPSVGDDPSTSDRPIEAARMNARAGTTESMDDAWVSAIYPRLFRTAWTMTGDPALAEDIVQESLVGAWNRWNHFQGSGSREAWVLGILIRQTRKHFRTLSRVKRRLQAYASVQAPTENQTDASETAVASEEWKRSIWAKVATLPRSQSEVVTLKYLDQLSHEEIAEAIGCPVGTVKSRLHHALKRLKQRFPQEIIDS
ncbi:MAG: RNA polymerase sigma factor [Planctomycetota bacterium]